MRSAAYGFVAAAAAALCLAPSALAQGPDPDETATVEGAVTQRGGGPLAGVCVELRPELASLQLRRTTTDAGGNYEFAGVQPENYFVGFRDCVQGPPAFYEQDFGASGEGEIGERIELAAGERFRADIALQRAPTISGRVTGMGGEPVVDACIGAYRTNDPYGYPVGITGADGRYSIPRHSVQLVAGAPYKLKVFDCSAAPHLGRFAEEWWDGEIVLGEGQDLDGIDFDVRPRGAIEGRVVDVDGQPVRFVCVHFEFGPPTVGLPGITDADGRYRISLPEGAYRLRFDPCPPFPTFPSGPADAPTSPGVAPEYWDDSPTLEDAETVIVRPGETTSGIDAELTRAGPEPCVVPTVTGKRVAKAKERLERANCEVGELKREPADKRAGRVLRSDPRKGTVRRYETPVDLAIGR